MRIYPEFRKRNFFRVINKTLQVDGEFYNKTELWVFLETLMQMEAKIKSKQLDHPDLFNESLYENAEYTIQNMTRGSRWNYGDDTPLERIWDIFYWYDTIEDKIIKPDVSYLSDPLALNLPISKYTLLEQTRTVIEELNKMNIDVSPLWTIHDDMLRIKLHNGFHFERYDHRIPANAIMEYLMSLDIKLDMEFFRRVLTHKY